MHDCGIIVKAEELPKVGERNILPRHIEKIYHSMEPSAPMFSTPVLV